MGRTLGLLALPATLLLLVAGPAAASANDAATPADEADPLKVTISNVTPAAIPARGPVRLSGTVTNVSDETWSLIKMYALVSETPVTSATDLEANAQADPYEVFGSRIIENLVDVGDLEPGASTSYSIVVPRDTLLSYLPPAATPGVYRIGVQALGETDAGREQVPSADGRAYSFIPLVAEDTPQVRAALVVPIRREVVYARDGSLRNVPSWTRDLGVDGRLGNLLDFAATAPPGAITWLIDPAVLEAAERLAQGNPPRDLGPVSAGTDPDESPSPTAGSAAQGSAAGRSLASETASAAASDWLARMVGLTATHRVLGLPYGDVDTSAANTLDPRVTARAQALSATAFTDLGISADPVVSPPSGYLEPSSVAALDSDVSILASTVIVSRDVSAEQEAPTTVIVNGHSVDLYDAQASSGGPGPTRPLSELAIRQRLVSEAALRSINESSTPLVVALPHDWNPGANPSGFFEGLDLPWLTLTAQQLLTQPDPPQVASEDLVYPERQSERELDSLNFDAAGRLALTGATLQNVLSDNTTIEREVSAQSLTTTSYFMRADPAAAEDAADRARRSLEDELNQVHISAPRFFTLSSSSGNSFRVDVRNDLEQTVTVLIDPVADGSLDITTPADPIVLEGGASTSLFLGVESTELGLHQVRLDLVDLDGTRFGPSADLPIRSSQSGRVIWVIIFVGAVLLFGAIAVRLFRRITGRTSHGDQG